MNAKIWNTTRTGVKVHAFDGGKALCRSSVKEGIAPAHSHGTARRWVLDTPGLSFCTACEAHVTVREETDQKTSDRAHAEALEISKIKEEETMTNSNTTPEVIKALATLRYRTFGSSDGLLIAAFNTLDNAGVFAAIDEATGYDIDGTDAAPGRISKCTCWDDGADDTQTHRAGCPGDPAEWGDMAYTNAK